MIHDDDPIANRFGFPYILNGIELVEGTGAHAVFLGVGVLMLAHRDHSDPFTVLFYHVVPSGILVILPEAGGIDPRPIQRLQRVRYTRRAEIENMIVAEAAEGDTQLLEHIGCFHRGLQVRPVLDNGRILIRDGAFQIDGHKILSLKQSQRIPEKRLEVSLTVQLLDLFQHGAKVTQKQRFHTVYLNSPSAYPAYPTRPAYT